MDLKTAFAATWILSTSLPGLARAADTGRTAADFVVKVVSQPCDDATVTAKGSGLAFRFRGKSFVLTSEHVVFHARRGFCHSVTSPLIARQAAELVSADWGRGLALLALPGLADNGTLPTLDALVARAHPSGDSLTVAGFPHAAGTLLKDPRCRVLVEKSQRALIPLVPTFLELDGCHVEYGMSGGIAFAPGASLTVAGIVSHQLLRPNVGRPASVVELNGELAPDDHDFFVIPWETASAFARDTLTKGLLPSSTRDPIAQLEGRGDVVLTNHLRFELVRTAHEGAEGGVGGPDGTGVGGPEGTGVGGPDGTGIGGKASAGAAAEIQVTASRSAAGIAYPLPSRAAWMQRLERATIRERAARISYFLEWHAGEVPSAKRISFRSVAEFFRLLARPELEPVATLTGDSPAKAANWKELGARLASAREAAQKIPGVEKSFAARRLLNQIGILGELVSSGNADFIQREWLKRLQSPKSQSWKDLVTLDFEKTVELLQLLGEVQSALAGARL